MLGAICSAPRAPQQQFPPPKMLYLQLGTAVLSPGAARGSPKNALQLQGREAPILSASSRTHPSLSSPQPSLAQGKEDAGRSRGGCVGGRRGKQQKSLGPTRLPPGDAGQAEPEFSPSGAAAGIFLGVCSWGCACVRVYTLDYQPHT